MQAKCGAKQYVPPSCAPLSLRRHHRRSSSLPPACCCCCCRCPQVLKFAVGFTHILTLALGLALTKRALAESGGNSLEAQLDLERDLQTVTGRSHDYREGIEAFMAKRPPRFEGR